MRSLVGCALVLAGCSKVLGISDPTPQKGDGGMRDGQMIDAMLDAPMIDSGPPCINAPSFGPEMTFDLGGNGVTIAVGDLDHDNKKDVAVGLGDRVVILHGDGMGGLGALQTIDTAADGVLIDDFDNDIRNDLILWKIGGSLVVERRQDITSAGTFLAEQPVTGTYTNIATVQSGFLDGNFVPDIIVKDDTQRRVLTSNLGTLGTFSAGPSLGTNEDVLSVFNIDNQKSDDVALVTPTGDVEQALGNGGGSFAAPQTIATGALGRGVAFGDMNGDTLPDLVLTSAQGGRVLLQQAGGQFIQQSGFVAGAGGPTLQILDIDNNTLDDLIVSGGIIQQCNGGMFSPIVTTFDVTPPVVFADLNRNNKPDIIRVVGTQLKVRIQ